MRRIASAFVLCLAAGLAVAAETGAEALLRLAAARITGAPSVSATCIVNSSGGASQVRLIMAGDKFSLQGGGIEVWYNGKDQWTYSKATKEVSLTTPTPEELSQINPVAILAGFSSANYSVTRLSSPKGLKRVALKARKPDEGITSATVTLAQGTLNPVAIDLVLSSGDRIAVSVSSFSIGSKLPASTFTYRPSFHPDAEIIDLR